MVRPKAIPLPSLIIAALLIRLAFSWVVFHDDARTNFWWGKFAYDFPLRGYYDWLEFGGYPQPDQPPLYILYYRFHRLLFVVSHNIFWWLNVNIPAFPSFFMQWYFEVGNLWLQKLIPIATDLIFIAVIFKLFPSLSSRPLLAIFIAFFPPFLYNTTFWGGNDLLLNLAFMASLYFMFKNRLLVSFLLLIFSMLFKTSLVLFLPIYLVAYLRLRHPPQRLLLLFGLTTGVVLLLSLPFATRPLIPWTTNLYLTTILPASMPHLTANAFNFWALLFGLSPIHDSLIIFYPLTARLVGFLLGLPLIILVYFSLYRHFSYRRLLLALSSITLISFFFFTRMHERYTFPALLPLILLTLNDFRYRRYLFLLTLTHILNVYNFWWFPRLPFLINLLGSGVIIGLLSLTNLYLLISLLRLQFTTHEAKSTANLGISA